MFRLIFSGNWREQTHPLGYPGVDAAFGDLSVAAHPADASFFSPDTAVETVNRQVIYTSGTDNGVAPHLVTMHTACPNPGAAVIHWSTTLSLTRLKTRAILGRVELCDRKRIHRGYSARLFLRVRSTWCSKPLADSICTHQRSASCTCRSLLQLALAEHHQLHDGTIDDVIHHAQPRLVRRSALLPAVPERRVDHISAHPPLSIRHRDAHGRQVQEQRRAGRSHRAGQQAV